MHLAGLILMLMFPQSEPHDPPRGELRLMWYNVENLFHPEDDTIDGDDEFTPDGVRRWTCYRYGKKLTGIAKVIVAAGIWEPPELVGLGEVEDTMVLDSLIRHPILAPYEYGYMHHNSPDHRGMDVACLYRKKRIEVVEWSAYTISMASEMDTRDALHVCAAWGKRDTLDLFLVHLISKYSGAGVTAEPRRVQAKQLIQLADSIRLTRNNSLLIIAGDFNEPYEGYSMEPFRSFRPEGDSAIGNHQEGGPVFAVPLEGMLGSYKYQGKWSRIDQYLVFCNPLPYKLCGSILELPNLLITDESHGGVKPFRTYSGFSYNGGISDHLPVILDISRHPFSGGLPQSAPKFHPDQASSHRRP